MLRKRRALLVLVVSVAVVPVVCALTAHFYGVGYGFSFCLAPADQRDMISRFEEEPLSSVAPVDAVLIEANATTYYCHNGRGGSPLDPEFAQVSRAYRTAVHHSLDELRRLADPAATAAGWRVISEREADQGAGHEPFVAVTYCKDFGERVGIATVRSEGRHFVVALDARARPDGQPCASLTA